MRAFTLYASAAMRHMRDARYAAAARYAILFALLLSAYMFDSAICRYDPLHCFFAAIA